MELSERIARYLATMAPAIEGSNGSGATYHVACLLWNGFGLSKDDAFPYLKMYSDRCQPPWSDKELWHKLDSAEKDSHDKQRGYLVGGNGHIDRSALVVKPRPPEPKPKIDPAIYIENWLKGFECGEEELYEASPIKPSEDYTQDGTLIVSHLFQSGEKVNFITRYKTYTRKADNVVKANPDGYGDSIEQGDLIARWCLDGMPRSEAGGWMRMNPVDGEGVDDANVTAYRHALLEWDGIPLALQMSFLARVPLPISCILTSGGASVHAWIRLDAQDRDEYEQAVSKLRDYLVNFGMDRKNKNPSRLSRLVGVKRVIGATGDGRQRLLYLNPEPSQKAIIP